MKAGQKRVFPGLSWVVEWTVGSTVSNVAHPLTILGNRLGAVSVPAIRYALDTSAHPLLSKSGIGRVLFLFYLVTPFEKRLQKRHRREKLLTFTFASRALEAAKALHVSSYLGRHRATHTVCLHLRDGHRLMTSLGWAFLT